MSTSAEDAITIRGKLGWAKTKQMTTFNLVVLRALMFTVGRFFPDLIRKLLQRLLITGKEVRAAAISRAASRWEGDATARHRRTHRATRGSTCARSASAPAQTSIYVVMSRTFQAGQLQPWLDLTETVAERARRANRCASSARFEGLLLMKKIALARHQPRRSSRCIYWKIEPDSSRLLAIFAQRDRALDDAEPRPWSCRSRSSPRGGCSSSCRARGQLGFGEANRLILVASVLNLVLPSKMGDIAKAWFMNDRGHLEGSLALSLVVFEKACDMLSLLLWCVFGLIVLPARKTRLFWTMTAGRRRAC